MARHLVEDEVKKLIADHKTGNYSQRKLSSKYKVSLGYVNKTIKDIAKVDEQAVNAGIAYATELAKKDEHSVNAIKEVVNEKTRHLEFINNITLKNLSVMGKKINEKTSIAEHKMIGEATHKAGQTLGVVDQFAPKVEITQNQQTNIQLNQEQKDDRTRQIKKDFLGIE